MTPQELEQLGIEIKAVEGLPQKLAGSVFVKTLSGDDFDAWQDQLAALPEKGSTGKRFAAFVAACACTDAGEPTFTAEQAGKLSIKVQRAIFTQGMDFNGLSERAKDDAKKD